VREPNIRRPGERLLTIGLRRRHALELRGDERVHLRWCPVLHDLDDTGREQAQANDEREGLGDVERS
jgi:hypothetical protein